MDLGPEHQEYLDLYQRATDSNLGAFLASATDDIDAMTGAPLDRMRRHAERMMAEPVDYWLSALQWWYGVSANMHLDRARARARGDGQPEGPLREPEAIYRPGTEALRSMQANLAQWSKRLGEAAPRRKRLGIAPVMLQCPGLPGCNPLAAAVNVAVTEAVNPCTQFAPAAGINGPWSALAWPASLAGSDAAMACPVGADARRGRDWRGRQSLEGLVCPE